MQILLDENDIKKPRVVAYFGASWMPGNKRLLKNLDTLSKKYTDIIFYYVNCDDFKALCKRNSIDSVPYYLLINNETQTKEGIKGMILHAALKSKISEIFKKEKI